MPDAIVMDLFVRSGQVVIRDVVVHSCCKQHHCDNRLCGKVLKMPSSAMLLVSSFSCVLVRTAAFVYGVEEGNGDGNKGGRQATTMVTKRAMATAMRVAGNKEGNGNGGKSNGNGVEVKSGG